MDKIIFERMQFYAYHGVFEEENRLGQKFEVDLELFLNLEKAEISDALEDTVNYALVYKVVKEIVTGTKQNLLEYLAGKIANELLKVFSIEGVRVKVSKMNPPIPGHMQSVSVEITRGVKNFE